jgi:hypothetical protein
MPDVPNHVSDHAPERAPEAPSRVFGLPSWIWLMLAACAVYAGNLSGPLLFDDEQSITDNPTLRDPTPLGLLLPPQETPVAGRPVPNFTLLLNRLAFGDSPTAYHAVNLVFHMLVTLLGFLLVRLTLAHGRVPETLRARAEPLAFVTACSSPCTRSAWSWCCTRRSAPSRCCASCT